jgi:UDP-N-acetyl-D-mannosaminuronate dehydrogenase
MGAEIRVHDPYVEHWWEFEQQDTYPGVGQSKAQFFRNQEKLKEIRIEQNLEKALKDANAVILAVPHEAYLNLDPATVVKAIGQPAAIIDCFGILSDDNIRRYFQLGCEVKGLGRGHIQRIKDEIRKA